MKLLVTGGAGFIGSNFVRYMLNRYKDYSIVNLDKLTYAGNLDNIDDIRKNKRHIFVRGDICDSKLVEKLVRRERVDAIINFAAETHVDRSIIDPEAFIRTDMLGTYTLLEVARKFSVNKYFQVSTDEVYGSIKQGSFSETSDLMPSSPYSASKAGADLLTLAYRTTYGLPILITRGSNTYGPYQYPEKLIPLFITNLLQHKKVPLYGDGKNVRDWLYVMDHCSGIDTVLHKGSVGEIYNVGGGNERTNLEITHMILEELDMKDDMIEFVKDRLGHDWRYSLNCAKLKALGWEPKYPFEKGIKDTVKWYEQNKKWWKKIKSADIKLKK
jgi:dTDP-glucose 4,6-dehydratase